MIFTRFPINELDVDLYRLFPKEFKRRIAFSIIFIIFFAIYLILHFFELVGLVQITIYSIYFKWFSLLVKQDQTEIILCFLEIFSDFGMFLFFLFIVIYIVYDFFCFFKSIFLNPEVDREGAKINYFDMKLIINEDFFTENYETIQEIDEKTIIWYTWFYLAMLALSALFFISAILISKYFFTIVAFSFESIFLFYICSFFHLYFIWSVVV